MKPEHTRSELIETGSHRDLNPFSARPYALPSTCQHIHDALRRFGYDRRVPFQSRQTSIGIDVSAGADAFDPVRNGNLPPMPYRDMPEPLSLGKVLGPSVILAGLGVASGEYILWPFMTSLVGPGFLWAAVLGVTVQYFLNMEIERYTLATGETAVCGFVRFWKSWGLLFCLFTILPNMWPGWATSGVTILTFLTGGGNVPLLTIGVLVASGIALTASPVVYQTLEKAQFFKVGLTLVFLAVAIATAISASAWADLPQAIEPPME